MCDTADGGVFRFSMGLDKSDITEHKGQVIIKETCRDGQPHPAKPL